MIYAQAWTTAQLGNALAAVSWRSHRRRHLYARRQRRPWLSIAYRGRSRAKPCAIDFAFVASS